MQGGFDVHGSAGPDPVTRLDFERLDVYRVALEFQALAQSIALPQGRREHRDQLDRAALSIVLNTAEGAGRIGVADKARFFAMARGSAMECAAVLDVLRATGWLRGRSASVAAACWSASFRCTLAFACGSRPDGVDWFRNVSISQQRAGLIALSFARILPILRGQHRVGRTT